MHDITLTLPRIFSFAIRRRANTVQRSEAGMIAVHTLWLSVVDETWWPQVSLIEFRLIRPIELSVLTDQWSTCLFSLMQPSVFLHRAFSLYSSICAHYADCGKHFHWWTAEEKEISRIDHCHWSSILEAIKNLGVPVRPYRSPSTSKLFMNIVVSLVSAIGSCDIVVSVVVGLHHYGNEHCRWHRQRDGFLLYRCQHRC